MKMKIAVIGGGIAGLTAAYLLHQKHDVTLFEKSGRLGGNAYTLALDDGEAVDIAATVFGRFSYKNLFKLFRKLGIETVGTFPVLPWRTPRVGASFYDLDTRKGLYLSPGIRALVSQRFDILKPGNIGSVLNLLRGVNLAAQAFRKGNLAGLSVQEAVERNPALTGDAKLMFIGCLCLISSMRCEEVLDAPADFFVERMGIYHDFMPPKALFTVSFPKNRTRSYIDALARPFRETVVLNANVSSVRRRNNRITLRLEGGREAMFDKVIFACNADQALRLLENPSAREKALLGSWRYTEGRVVVHSDHSFFPRTELMQGFTFLYRREGRYIDTSVSGSLWSLPGVSKSCRLISTQHPNFSIAAESIVFEKKFRTPIFDFGSCATIAALPSLNGKDNTYYCGSHFGFGLHEDAVTSAINVARSLAVDF